MFHLCFSVEICVSQGNMLRGSTLGQLPLNALNSLLIVHRKPPPWFFLIMCRACDCLANSLLPIPIDFSQVLSLNTGGSLTSSSRKPHFGQHPLPFTTTAENCGGPKISLYLRANKVACSSLKDSGTQHRLLAQRQSTIHDSQW